MGWMNELYQTYDNNIACAGIPDAKGNVLPILAHSVQNAQLEIVLDPEGKFLDAYPVDKKDGKTLIPVTEASAGRSNAPAPHALCDTLSYIAGDYGTYDTSAKKVEEKHKKYIDALNQWTDSRYSTPKIKAIRDYIVKNTMMKDLINKGIVKLNEEGMLSNEKIAGNNYEKVLVRFRVIGIPGDMKSSTWEDTELINQYVKYYLSNQAGKKDICYLTGEEAVITNNHPKGIVAANYGAKLISANDGQGFTYRGRFVNADQACTISYEATQKVHMALTWLAAKQGVQIGTKSKRTYVFWNPSGKEVPPIDDEWEEDEDTESVLHLTAEEYAKKVRSMLNGFQEKYEDSDQIVVIALDAATTGRLSIVYYNEYNAKLFFDHIYQWRKDCNWFFTCFTKDKKPYLEIKTPRTKDIIRYAFGTEKGAYVDTTDQVLKEQTQRLYHCILDQMKIPNDIVRALTNRVSIRQAYSRGNWERLLCVTCAVIKMYHKQYFNKEDSMELEKENSNRSYLFGRLLAVLERVERVTYNKGEARDTNAERLWNAYVNHPYATYQVIYGNLQPYFSKLSEGSKVYYKNLIGEITELLSTTDPVKRNQMLEADYLMGYYLQRADFMKNKNEKKEEE